MTFDYYSAAMTRRSVRSYSGEPVRDEHKKLAAEYALQLQNPFGTVLRVVWLDAREHSLSSPVLTGEREFIAALMPKGTDEAGYGFALEELGLYLKSLGLGTVWIAGTMNRGAFEQAAGKKDDEIMPCISPVGYPAKSMSIRETLMRKGVKADSRKPFEEILFKDSFDLPLAREEWGNAARALEMLRRAPSAVNRQPWRAVFTGGAYHFFEKRDKGYDNETTGDLQRIDVGMALCHFWLGLKQEGLEPKLEMNEPDISKPENVLYVASVKI